MLWRPVPDFPLYEASEGGHIRNARTGQILKERPNKHGVLVVDLHRGVRYGLAEDVKQTTRAVHVLVCLTFHGPKPEGKEATHRNGKSQDNRARNLRWLTHLENIQEKKLHGTWNHGTRNGGAKITEVQARAIIADPRQHHAIGHDFGISRQQVSRIKSGKKWKHLSL